MLPSVLASQVRRGIEDFLRTTFPIHTPHFDGVLERLLDASSGYPLKAGQFMASMT